MIIRHALGLLIATIWTSASFSQRNQQADARNPKPLDAKNQGTGLPPAERDPKFAKYLVDAATAPRPNAVIPIRTTLPLELNAGDHVLLIGNSLFDRDQWFGYFETMLHQHFADKRLVVRNLAWSADTVDMRPRPENFADLDQQLLHERADVIFVAVGFNESFAGESGLEAYHQSLTEHVVSLKTKAFNGETAPRIVLVSPIANEDVPNIPAGTRNNENLRLYTRAMMEVAAQQQVGFVDVFAQTLTEMSSPGSDLTINGCHVNDAGSKVFARSLFEGTFAQDAPTTINEPLRLAILDRNRQYFRRYRPLNTFYYTGGRNKEYGYLDFLPAMRNFEMLVANRDAYIWDLAAGKSVSAKPDDSQIPPLPPTDQTRGANEWITASEELKAFQIDPRFEVNLFAGEEQFPEIANPIQMRWDSRGRLWVSCSTTYPHVYPGQEPSDKLIILEDTDHDGRADTSKVFADNLHVPLSFELGDGGVYVSEQPHLTFLQDTDGDDRADVHRVVLTGFGTEDSHHALHDFTWTPDGDLLFRESIFHHSQVETPYGPVRQQNSGWFRFEPRTQRLTSFGSYPSTNPWGVTFDDWGQHVASHPIYAAAFHSLDPAYPRQHAAPTGLQAYSGTCGHEFVDFKTFPDELQGMFIKARYKPTNRVEILKWKQTEFGFDEEYVSDLIFSTNLSFIPVDIGYGPDGAMYVCDWYNPIKGHAQYSLRDERRDRHSGRIWRITTKGREVLTPVRLDQATTSELVELLKAPEYRYRYWAKRELRERDHAQAVQAIHAMVGGLSDQDPRTVHHRLEAFWGLRWLGEFDLQLLESLLSSEEPLARAAAVEQLRYVHAQVPDHCDWIRIAANDSSPIVRMQAAIAASHIGSESVLDAMLDVLTHPRGGHLAYAIECALQSHTLRAIWMNNPKYDSKKLQATPRRSAEIVEPKARGKDLQFDRDPGVHVEKISCQPERMLFSVKQFAVSTGQKVKIVLTNPDATDHNLVVIKPDTLAEVGMAANEMAKDPRNANSDFIPESKRELILHATKMIGPTRTSQVEVLRFNAPQEPGIYPYVCTFPGHWIVMNGEMIVAQDLADVPAMLAERKPAIVKHWTLADFENVVTSHDDATLQRGMQALVKANCHQCHVVAGHGVNLGPNLVESVKKYQGKKLLEQIISPSLDVQPTFQNKQFLMVDGRIVTGVVVKETPVIYEVATQLLTPDQLTRLKKSEVDEVIPAKLSPMPEGLLDVLTREEVLDLLSLLEAGDQLPASMRHAHP